MPEVTETAALSHAELQALLDAMLADYTAIRTVLAGILSGSATWDLGSLVDGAGESKDITVTGAALGDFVLVSLGVDIQDMTISAQVTAEDTVTVRVQNESGGTLDLASTTVRVRVIPQASFAAPAALTVTT
jgi:hypothetical protein